MTKERTDQRRSGCTSKLNRMINLPPLVLCLNFIVGAEQAENQVQRWAGVAEKWWSGADRGARSGGYRNAWSAEWLFRRSRSAQLTCSGAELSSLEPKCLGTLQDTSALVPIWRTVRHWCRSVSRTRPKCLTLQQRHFGTYTCVCVCQLLIKFMMMMMTSALVPKCLGSEVSWHRSSR